MSRRNPAPGSPLVLLVNDEEWTARSLDTVLKSHGYAVLMAFTGKQALDLSAKVHPDCVLVDYGLPDMTGADLCAQLRAVPTIRDSMPLLVVSSQSLPRPTRLACLESGAWDVLRIPFDADEFTLRLDRYIGAKTDADRALEHGHLDQSTGFYNVQGLTKRLTELVADASRNNRPLACVALGFAPDEAEAVEEEEAEHQEVDLMARILTAVTRMSDVVARVGNDDFVVVAPSTDETGAQRLADRLFESFSSSRTELDIPGLETLNLRAGYHAVDDPTGAGLLPENLLSRATAALRDAQVDKEGSWIKAFDSNRLN